MKEGTLLKKSFTLLCATTQIWIMYSINGLPLVLVLICVWLIFLMLNLKKITIVVTAPLIVFIAYLILSVGLNYLFIPEYSGTLDIFSTVNFVFHLCIAFSFSKKYFDYDYAYKIYRLIVIFSTCYIVLQYILFHLGGHVLSGYLPFLETEYIDPTLKNYEHVTFRPSGIFPEPAAYATYTSLFLLLHLFQEKIDGKLVIFSIIGIMLTQSSSGFVLVAVVIVFYLLAKKPVLKREHVIYFPIFALVMGGMIIFFVQNGIIDRVISHMFSFQNGTITFNSGFNNRMGNVLLVANKYFNNLWNIMLGTGFREYTLSGDSSVFLPGVAKLFFSVGIMGTMCYVLLLVNVFKKASIIARLLILFMLVASIGANTLTGIQPIIYFPLILSAHEYKTNKMIERKF